MSLKQYRAWPSPDQSFLFPPSPRDWLPDDHLVYFVLDVVELLDLSPIESVFQAKDPRGERPYNPAMMVALLIYAYCTGIFSSRKIARATHEQVAFRVLTGGQHPHFTRINGFRKSHLAAFAGLFKQVLVLCQKAGLVKLGHVALDGTKIQGNASKHKAMSYKRMQELESRLECEIAALLSRAEETDTTDDRRLGAGEDEEDLPAELKRRTDRLKKLREAKEALETGARKARAAHLRELAKGCEERAASTGDEGTRKRNQTLARAHCEKADELDDPDDDNPTSTVETPEGLPMHRPRTTPEGKPSPEAQRGFTDPDSRIMESNGGFLQGYNCQAAVDEAHQIVVGAAVSNQCPDSANFEPMMREVVASVGIPRAATGDAGYWKPGVEESCEAHGIDAYIATERRKHWDADPAVTSGSPPDDASARDRMRHKLRTAEGRAIYARRKATVEPVFGQMKEVRGFRRFSLRGFTAVRAEWLLLCLTHNMLKLFRAGYVPAAVS
jgi:transposase